MGKLLSMVKLIMYSTLGFLVVTKALIGRNISLSPLEIITKNGRFNEHCEKAAVEHELECICTDLAF